MPTEKPSRATPAASQRAATEKAATEKQATGSAPADDDRDALLRQLVELTASVKELAQRPAQMEAPAAVASPAATPSPDGGGVTITTPPERSPAENEQLTVLFAYDFLGEVLGRTNFRFTPRVAVSRNENGLTFTDLRGGTFARVRAANNQVEVLENLVVNTPVKLKVIPDDQAIDAIVVLERRDGVPVGIGNCLGPVPGIIIV